MHQKALAHLAFFIFYRELNMCHKLPDCKGGQGTEEVSKAELHVAEWTKTDELSLSLRNVAHHVIPVLMMSVWMGDSVLKPKTCLITEIGHSYT